MPYFLITLFIAVLDQGVKFIVQSKMHPFQSISFFGGVVSLTYAQNFGAAFSIFWSQTLFLALVSIGVFTWVWFYRKKLRTYPKTLQIGVAIALGGAVGNFIDRVRLGYVVDMGDEAKAKEKFEDALALYKKALYYYPTSVEAKSKFDALSQDMVSRYYNLGRTYESQNQLEAAFKEYEKAYTYNPNYQDIADRYTRLKAKLHGNIPLRAILFFVNRSSQLGIETPLIQSFQAELTESAKESGKFSMIDYRKVQAVVEEQAKGLGENLNDSLAMDLGRILGANEVIIGEIVSEGKQGNKYKINARILRVPKGEVVKEVNISHSFSEKELADFQKEIPDLAKDLAKKITSHGLFGG